MKNGGQIPWNGIPICETFKIACLIGKVDTERRFGLCKKAASMIIGISMDQEIFSGSWTGFTQFTLSSEKPPEGYMWSGGRSTRKQLTSRSDHLWPEF